MNKLRIGIYNPYITTRGGGEKLTIAIAEHLSKTYDVSLIVREEIEPKKLASYFNANLDGVQIVVPEPATGFFYRLFTTHKIPWPISVRSLAYAIADYHSLKKFNFDIFINNLYQSSLLCPAPKGIYICMFPQEIQSKMARSNPINRLYRSVLSRIERQTVGSPAEALASYQVVAAISKFTGLWIKKRWDRESSLLYPFCEPIGLPKGFKKEKIILHTGRYFANMGENHHKRQDILIDAFKEMRASHVAGWQLHMIGSTAQDADSLQYALKMVEKSEGLPIFFHFNAEYETLKNLYQKASIYWHATGYGKDANLHPEKQEHFGITTVEAMSAGAVPVVINSAGQKETVTDSISGYLWDTPNMLKEKTNSLIANPKLLQEMSAAAILQSEAFGRKAFNAQLDDLLDELVERPS